jgi:hypothetical protein
MEMEIKIKGCPHEDQDTLLTYFLAPDMRAAIHETRERLRSLIKYHDLSEEAEEYLQEIRQMLYIEGLE